MNRPVVAILIDWRTLVLSLALVGAFLLSFCIDPAEARVEDNPTVAARSHMADKAESALLVGATCVGDVVLVSGNHGLILRSADGGKTYQQIEAPTRRMLTAIILDSQGTAFAVGHDTTVLRSRDSGLSWQSVYCDPEADLGLFSIQAIGDSRVVAVGAFGTLLISVNKPPTFVSSPSVSRKPSNRSLRPSFLRETVVKLPMIIIAVTLFRTALNTTVIKP